MLKKRPKFPKGYKRFKLEDKYKLMVKYGDYTKISNKYSINLSSVSYAFSSGWATYTIINAIESFYNEL